MVHSLREDLCRKQIDIHGLLHMPPLSKEIAEEPSSSILLLEKIGIVFSNSFGVGVLGSQLAFSDGQGTLVERLRLLVLPLVGVEVGQVIETAGGVEASMSFTSWG